MYPQRELGQLAGDKAALRRHIAVNRLQCAGALQHVMRPLAWLDRMLVLWRQLSPLLRRVPFGVLVQRASRPRWKILGSLVAWSPLVFDAVRAWRSVTRPSAQVARTPGMSSADRR